MSSCHSGARGQPSSWRSRPNAAIVLVSSTGRSPCTECPARGTRFTFASGLRRRNSATCEGDVFGDVTSAHPQPRRRGRTLGAVEVILVDRNLCRLSIDKMVVSKHRVTERPKNSPRIRRALSTTTGRAPKIVPDATPPPDASTTFASPANDDPTRSYTALVAVVWDVLSGAGSSDGRVRPLRHQADGHPQI